MSQQNAVLLQADGVALERVPHGKLGPEWDRLEGEIWHDVDPESQVFRDLAPKKRLSIGHETTQTLKRFICDVGLVASVPFRLLAIPARCVNRNRKAFLAILLLVAVVVGVSKLDVLKFGASATKPAQVGKVVKAAPTQTKVEVPAIAPVVAPAATVSNQPAPNAAPQPAPQSRARPTQSRVAAPLARPIVAKSPVVPVTPGRPTPPSANPAPPTPVAPVQPAPPAPVGDDSAGPGTTSDTPPDQASGDCPSGQHKVPPMWTCA